MKIWFNPSLTELNIHNTYSGGHADYVEKDGVLVGEYYKFNGEMHFSPVVEKWFRLDMAQDYVPSMGS